MLTPLLFVGFWWAIIGHWKPVLTRNAWRHIRCIIPKKSQKRCPITFGCEISKANLSLSTHYIQSSVHLAPEYWFMILFWTRRSSIETPLLSPSTPPLLPLSFHLLQRRMKAGRFQLGWLDACGCYQCGHLREDGPGWDWPHHTAHLKREILPGVVPGIVDPLSWLSQSLLEVSATLYSIPLKNVKWAKQTRWYDIKQI